MLWAKLQYFGEISKRGRNSNARSRSIRGTRKHR